MFPSLCRRPSYDEMRIEEGYKFASMVVNASHDKPIDAFWVVWMFVKLNGVNT